VNHKRQDTAQVLWTGDRFRRNWRVALLVAYALVMQSFVVASMGWSSPSAHGTVYCTGVPILTTSLDRAADPTSSDQRVAAECDHCIFPGRFDVKVPEAETAVGPVSGRGEPLAAKIYVARPLELLITGSARGPPGT